MASQSVTPDYVPATIEERWQQAWREVEAFGLPSEIGAIKNELTPVEWVEQCRVRMHAQFDRLGYSFDWEREWVTSYPALYKWTQWLFLLLLRRELVYHAEGQVDWCDNCRTVLASL